MSGETLKKLRVARGLTLEEAADRIGVSVSQVSRFEAELREPRQSELRRMADLYNVPVTVLFDESASQATEVPIISWVSAGDMARDDVRDDALGTITMPDLPEGDWIALRVDGTSMDKVSPPGSLIFVNRRDKRLVPNALYVIADEEGNATYKRFRPSPDRFEPVSMDDTHETLFPEGAVTVVGRVRRSMIDM